LSLLLPQIPSTPNWFLQESIFLRNDVPSVPSTEHGLGTQQKQKRWGSTMHAHPVRNKVPAEQRRLIPFLSTHRFCQQGISHQMNLNTRCEILKRQTK